MDMKQESITEILKSAHQEFDNISDYVWKSPRLIEQETKLEVEKLDDYFPLTGNRDKDSFMKKLRVLRWHHESHKLEHVFPNLIATGNLFNVVATFEAYCMLLCKELEELSGKPISNGRRMGINRLFEYMSLCGIPYKEVQLHEQVAIAIKVRNCLVHASGLLPWSREERELRRVVSKGEYLSPDTRVRYKKLGQPFDRIKILTTPLGDQLYVTNTYAHMVCSYARDHFCDLCRRVLTLLDQANERPREETRV